MDERYEARVVGRGPAGDRDTLSFDHLTLDGADYSGSKVAGFTAIGSTFRGCRFVGARVGTMSFGAGREVTTYTDCVFDGLRFRAGIGGYARLERCSFRDVDLRDWFAFAVELVGCTFTGRLRGCVFNGTPLPDDLAVVGRDRNVFEDNDFSGADLVDVAFRTGIDLSRQSLPRGADYLYLDDAAAVLARVRGVVQTSWDDLGKRQRTLRLIDAMESELYGGQRQMLLRQGAVDDDLFRLVAEHAPPGGT